MHYITCRLLVLHEHFDCFNCYLITFLKPPSSTRNFIWVTISASNYFLPRFCNSFHYILPRFVKLHYITCRHKKSAAPIPTGDGCLFIKVNSFLIGNRSIQNIRSRILIKNLFYIHNLLIQCIGAISLLEITL